MRSTLMRSKAALLPIVLVALFAVHACSPARRHKTLKVFFDGVPDPGAAAVEETPPARSGQPGGPPRPGSPAVPPGPTSPGTEPLAEPPVPLPSSPLESSRTWEELLVALPTDYAGGVDWVRAETEGLVAPKLLPGSVDPAAPPFTLDTLVRAGTDHPERPFLDLDVVMAPEENPFFEVRFPHAAHTLRLNCSSCHPGASAMRTRMDRILGSESCGRCHGKVAFDPEISCARCHPGLQPPPQSIPDEELSQARGASNAPTPESTARGRELYGLYCAFCHGEDGDGQGRLAPHLETKPRDFTAGKYKFRSTIGTSLPTDLDLFMTLTRGVPGTSMPAWSALSTEDRWGLTDFIKTFSERFEKEKPDDPLSIPEPPTVTDDLLAQGKDLYKQAGCHSCHGEAGRGDGPSADTLKDDWKNPIRPFDFASGRPMKSGSSVSDLFRIIMTGLPGTPMPGFGEVLPPEMAWALSSYVGSLRGTATRPFAVRGDIVFERREPSEEELERAAETAPTEITPEQMAEDELFLLAGKDTPPAIFPHWFHRIRFKCSSCHPAIFEMKAGANPITMTAMRRGEFCANCHDGGTAWEIGFTTCVRCHVSR